MTPITDKQERLFLHIGFHKTGSSALQHCLTDNRKALRQAGLVYPQPILDLASHAELSFSLGFENPVPFDMGGLDRNQVIERYAGLLRDVPADTDVLISCEEFCLGSYSTEAMVRLAKFLDDTGLPTTVVAYVRDPIDYLISIYHHQVRDTDYSEPLTTFLQSFDLRNAYFEGRLKVWRDLVGDANVEVRDYDDISARGSNVALDMLEVCGVSADSIRAPLKRVNQGIHPALVPALLAVRKSDMTPEQQLTLQKKILGLGPEMPKIDAAKLYLDDEKIAEINARLKAIGEQPDPMKTYTPVLQRAS